MKSTRRLAGEKHPLVVVVVCTVAPEYGYTRYVKYVYTGVVVERMLDGHRHNRVETPSRGLYSGPSIWEVES